MTPAEWLASTDPLALVRHLRGRPAAAPSRWFGLALGLPPTLPEGKLRQLLDAICDHPPGEPDAELAAMRATVRDLLRRGEPVPAVAALLHAFTGIEPLATAGRVYDLLAVNLLQADRHNPPLADAVRCLFADPSHPPPGPFPWRTPTVVQIAFGIADESAFDRLPVLADALEDAGCDRAPLLAHLRSTAPHRPGCHALDAVRGR
jgi:hypothetical protein